MPTLDAIEGNSVAGRFTVVWKQGSFEKDDSDNDEMHEIFRSDVVEVVKKAVEDGMFNLCHGSGIFITWAIKWPDESTPDQLAYTINLTLYSPSMFGGNARMYQLVASERERYLVDHPCVKPVPFRCGRLPG